ncbi:hypothetical protein [Flavobacterium degerlachei]|uniref:Alpha-ketoglutarate decarboxylase n=1 Tax=Flavobacterium degerlachei TaxID=229203 RepID=A0A1H2Q1I2_9FLAO|nr:hypothetical protein [Flavobacterium degerlachei]SDW00983.1 hypothetical protein SAMN05444338_10161 [Flavobacterium degerlachei]
MFMRKNQIKCVSKAVLVVITLLFSNKLLAQDQRVNSRSNADFWDNVQFGGGIGLGFGSGYTDISLTPSAIYNFNEYVALGLGAQYSYVSQKNYYNSHLYGGSIIALFNPIREIQLSAELEELRVNINPNDSSLSSEQFWNTGLFLGAGYRTANVTMGVRYNVLQDDSKNVYSDAFMPFVRVYF